MTDDPLNPDHEFQDCDGTCGDEYHALASRIWDGFIEEGLVSPAMFQKTNSSTPAGGPAGAHTVLAPLPGVFIHVLQSNDGHGHQRHVAFTEIDDPLDDRPFYRQSW